LPTEVLMPASLGVRLRVVDEDVLDASVVVVHNAVRSGWSIIVQGLLQAVKRKAGFPGARHRPADAHACKDISHDGDLHGDRLGRPRK